MFSRQKCLEYARRYTYEYNNEFYDFSTMGGDCTNFISQCMFYGGFEMNFAPNGWYYVNLNNRSPSWTGVEEFWNFGINNAGKGVSFSLCELNELEVADIIQLYNGTRYYHTLLVTDVENEIRVTAHTYDAYNVPLNRYAYVSFRCGKIKTL